jgi:hypothetical protein
LLAESREVVDEKFSFEVIVFVLEYSSKVAFNPFVVFFEIFIEVLDVYASWALDRLVYPWYA